MGKWKDAHLCEFASGRRNYATSWNLIRNLQNHISEFSRNDGSMDFWTCKFETNELKGCDSCHPCRLVSDELYRWNLCRGSLPKDHIPLEFILELLDLKFHVVGCNNAPNYCFYFSRHCPLFLRGRNRRYYYFLWGLGRLTLCEEMTFRLEGRRFHWFFR